MSKQTMSATIELDADFVARVAEYAIEGADWAICFEMRDEPKGATVADHLANGGIIRFCEVNGGEKHQVDGAQFAQAIGTFLQRVYVDETLHFCYLDDATAEVVLQLAAFGEVVYG